tara:strand:+ start:22526 stop:23170 length:645 start_codon:yes stop_codon:yes gene_type:complete
MTQQYDDFDTILSNSFCGWHSPHLNYLCLKRTPERVHKVYFIEHTEDPVVSPHNHRFNFETYVLRGDVVHHTYVPCAVKQGELYQKFHYHSPNVGGEGFAWVGEQRLQENRQCYSAGERFFLWADKIHTLRSARPGKILILEQIQREDIVPARASTDMYQKGISHDPPSLEGLYRKPDRVAVREWLDTYFSLRGDSLRGDSLAKPEAVSKAPPS